MTILNEWALDLLASFTPEQIAERDRLAEIGRQHMISLCCVPATLLNDAGSSSYALADRRRCLRPVLHLTQP